MQSYSAGNKFGKPNQFQKPKGKFQKPTPGKFGKSTDGPAKPAAALTPAPEKVDWNKFKQEKKELRLKRKASKLGFDKIQEAKRIYEKLKWYVQLFIH